MCGTKYAVAVSSGTCSLEIVMRSWGIGKGDSVLVPTNTFFATPAAVRHAGADVVFVDHDVRTLAPSLAHIQNAVQPNTKAVAMVHVGGTVSDEMPAIRAWCDQKGLLLMEDAAHAHGSTLNGKFAGSFGHAASFSFYPTKVMTSGEGGMITTNDENLAIDARRYRDQGKESFTVNKHTRLGNNWRMSEIHAVVGLQQLKNLPDFLNVRRKMSHLLQDHLRDVQGLVCFSDPRGVENNFYKFMAVLAPQFDRATFKKTLKEHKQVSCAGEVYEMACHQQPIFEGDSACHGRSFPNAEDFCKRHICLPMYANMTEGEIAYIAHSVKEVLSA